MRRVKGSAKERRRLDGAVASKRLLRWPARNYFAEIEPRLKEGHPIDDLMAADPGLSRIRRQARQRLNRLKAHADSDALLEFEATRNHLDSVRVEVAYNIGFEGGLIAGRAEGLRRGRAGRSGPGDSALRRDLRAAIVGSSISTRDVQAVLLELAWAVALGGHAVADEISRRPSHRRIQRRAA